MSSMQVTVPRKTMATCILALCIAGCGHEAVRRVPDGRTAEPVADHRSPGETAAVVAKRQVGVPYRYGGTGARGFDCSGLVQYAWSKAGVRLPRTTSEQWRRTSPVQANDLRTGDLLFFRIDGRISHVGLYLGGGRFVHAPSTGRTVAVARLDAGYYRETFAGATRP